MGRVRPEEWSGRHNGVSALSGSSLDVNNEKKSLVKFINYKLVYMYISFHGEIQPLVKAAHFLLAPTLVSKTEPYEQEQAVEAYHLLL